MAGRMRSGIKDFLQQADLVLLGLCCVCTLFGIAMIYSATRWIGNERYIVVQSAALLIGIVVYYAVSLVDVETLTRRWKWIVALNILLFLLLKTPFGVSDNTGNTAWLKFPHVPVSIGPAEIVKITFVLLLAKQLSWLKEEVHDLRSFRAAVFTGGHALGLAGFYFLISGDMGNALMFVLIFVMMAFVAGFALRWFAVLFGGLLAGAIAAWLTGLVPVYIEERFRVLFDHAYKPQSIGWQQNRSLLSLGGGGLTGQGYLHGTQTQGVRGSLPARHTDLIFSVIGEELGLLGALAVIILLTAIVIRVLLAAKHAAYPFHSYICIGMAAMLVFQTVINIGMCLFIMPVIGLTLPFFSYGGSSVVTLFAAMGVVSGIEKRTPERFG